MADISQFTDTEIVAKTAYGENRSGGRIGMQSVINVIINRANHPSWWGKNIRDVCLKPMQFDCWNHNDPNYLVITGVNESNAIYAAALELANQAVNGRLPDITNGSTYYFAKSIAYPYWAKGHIPTRVVAGQLFFNDIG